MQPFLIISLFLGLTSFANNAFSISRDESSCSSVRLDKHGGSFEKIPVYNQGKGKGGLGLCFAISTAELIDAHCFNRTGKPCPSISPISIGLIYHDDKKLAWKALPIEEVKTYKHPAAAVIGEGGQIDRALELSQGMRVCDQRWLSNYVKLNSNKFLFFKSPRSVNDFVLKGLALIEAFAESRNIQNELKIFKTHNEFLCSHKPELETDDIIEALSASISKEHTISKFRAFMESLCKKNEHVVEIPKPQVLEKDFPFLYDNSLSEEESEKAEKVANAEQAKQFIKKADELLNTSPPIPIGVQFNSELLESRKLDVHAFTDHVEVIIGRRFNTISKRCEYLVRNSWGQCKTNENYPWPCDNGSNWIDQEAMMKAAGKISWLPNTK